MEKFEPLHNAWREMGLEANKGPGTVQRRIAASTPHHVYATLKLPEGLPGLFVDAPAASAQLSSGESARGFLLIRENLPSAGRVRFWLVLTEKRYLDLFRILAADVLANALKEKNQEAGASAFIARVERWKRFLEVAGESGLSFEAQVGLAGELFILRWLVNNLGIPPMEVLSAWIGPDRQSKDFVFSNVALEVKATTAKLPKRIRITNEYQLDAESLDALFLSHVVFDISDISGETLPDFVRSTGEALGNPLEGEYYERLATAGYLESDAEHYGATRYTLRFLQNYHVTEGFPKIAALDLAQGISDVSYSVGLGNISAFAAEDAELLHSITNHQGI